MAYKSTNKSHHLWSLISGVSAALRMLNEVTQGIRWQCIMYTDNNLRARGSVVHYVGMAQFQDGGSNQFITFPRCYQCQGTNACKQLIEPAQYWLPFTNTCADEG